jgi:hypothetical protein
MLSLAQTTGLSFAQGDGLSDPSMVVNGTLTNLNAALAMVTYLPNRNVTGADTLTVHVDDGAPASIGGPRTDTKTIAITIAAVNDLPTPTPPPVVVTVTRAGANRLLVTITATGTLHQIEWTPVQNVSVEDPTGTPVVGGVLALPGNSRAATLYVRRLSGTSATLPLTLTGSFGTWQTFVGGGPDAW